jgi:hypothetical protein
MMRQLVVVLLCAMAGWAQTPPQEPQTPPGDYSGMYTFLQEGEFVQVSIDPDGRVSGFVSRYADPHEKGGLFLDHFFETASLKNGYLLSFTTKTVHGVHYDFTGAMGRGEGKTKAQEGYYIIHGTLTEYTSDPNGKVSARSREVTFKSFPQDVEDGNEGSRSKR